MSLHFLGIGAQKTGTTWLYALLNTHPDIAFPGGKEVHFWDRYEHGVATYGEEYTDSPEVRTHIEQYTQAFSAKDVLCGDITPAYAILSKETIQRIHSHFPDVRLIFITRNPVDRAWSSALMALNKAQMGIDEASDQWFIDHFSSDASRMRGNYMRTLDNWLEIYPKEQLLLLEYEDIGNAPDSVIAKVCGFLDIDATHFAEHPLLHKRVFAGAKHELRPTLRPVLEALYVQRNKELKEKYRIDYTSLGGG